MRMLLLVALLGFATTPDLAPDSSKEAAAYTVDLAPRECCKICKARKACGDSCISRDKECHKPPGCACDG